MNVKVQNKNEEISDYYKLISESWFDDDSLTSYKNCVQHLKKITDIDWHQVIEIETDSNIYEVEYEFVYSLAVKEFERMLDRVSSFQSGDRYLYKNYILTLVNVDENGNLSCIILNGSAKANSDDLAYFENIKYSKLAYQFLGRLNFTELNRESVINTDQLERIMLDYKDSYILEDASRLQFESLSEYYKYKQSSRR